MRRPSRILLVCFDNLRPYMKCRSTGEDIHTVHCARDAEQSGAARAGEQAPGTTEARAPYQQEATELLWKKKLASILHRR
ncbi:hypothetical protein MHYP_G00287370 [Metynnis hypsauchen]